MTALTDADIIKGTKRGALFSWLAALLFGLMSWGARSLGLETMASALFALVWIAVAGFLISWLILAISIVVLLAGKFKGDGT